MLGQMTLSFGSCPLWVLMSCCSGLTLKSPPCPALSQCVASPHSGSALTSTYSLTPLNLPFQPSSVLRGKGSDVCPEKAMPAQALHSVVPASSSASALAALFTAQGAPPRAFCYPLLIRTPPSR